MASTTRSVSPAASHLRRVAGTDMFENGVVVVK